MLVKENRKHILVTGTHRSGTTWVGRTLSKTKNVELVYEPFNPETTRYNFEYKFDHWFEHVPTSQNYREIKREFDRYIPNTAFQYPAKICRESGYNWKTPLIYLKYLLLSGNRPRYLLKDPIALLSAGWLYERYQLKVICMIRNPLAFAGSLKKQGWDFDFKNFLNQEKLINTRLEPFKKEIEKTDAEGDFIDRISLLWNVLNFVILDYRETYPEWLFMKHEKLAQDPIENFRKMFTYLDLEFSEEIEQYIREFTSKQNPAEAESNDYQPRDSKQTIHTWKNRLTDDEAKRVKEKTAKIYRKLYTAEES
ncbi:MAG: sulfotransferase domain-containing protein [Balneolaceae bacterium]|nr:sulfotransferase domain-containing protein [Balneolaceae bacterium]